MNGIIWWDTILIALAVTLLVLLLCMIIPPFQGVASIFGSNWNFDKCISKAYRAMTKNLSGCGQLARDSCNSNLVCVGENGFCGRAEENCICTPADNCYANQDQCTEQGLVCTKQPPPCNAAGCLKQNECDSPEAFCTCAIAGFPVCVEGDIPSRTNTIQSCEQKIYENCINLVAGIDFSSDGALTCANLCQQCQTMFGGLGKEWPDVNTAGICTTETQEMCGNLYHLCSHDKSKCPGFDPCAETSNESCPIYNPDKVMPEEYDGEFELSDGVNYL